jgi:DNA segregation ATPase FtsK/SpoIIIE-like protein
MRAVIAQLVFHHGPDHLRLVVVSADTAEWDWVKWLPHAGDPTVTDAAGPVRMVYPSVADFAAVQFDAVLKGRDAFRPRHAAVHDPIRPLPHTVVINDLDDDGWASVIGPLGVEGTTFFDLAGSVPPARGASRVLRVDPDTVIRAVPRDGVTWAAYEEDPQTFFAVADQMSRADAESFAMHMARWRLAEAYEIGDTVEDLGIGRPRDILSYWGITDPGHIDFPRLWAGHSDINSVERLRIPFGNRTDTGELVVLDMKDIIPEKLGTDLVKGGDIGQIPLPFG